MIVLKLLLNPDYVIKRLYISVLFLCVKIVL